MKDFLIQLLNKINSFVLKTHESDKKQFILTKNDEFFTKKSVIVHDQQFDIETKIKMIITIQIFFMKLKIIDIVVEKRLKKTSNCLKNEILIDEIYVNYDEKLSKCRRRKKSIQTNRSNLSNQSISQKMKNDNFSNQFEKSIYENENKTENFETKKNFKTKNDDKKKRLKKTKKFKMHF